jgi:hypothetical protein
VTFGFAYASVWYHYITIGHTEHIQIQAKIHAKQGIWVTIHFPSGMVMHFWQETDRNGFWQTSFKITRAMVGATSNQAIVTFQLWNGNRTTKTYSTFRMIR